MTHLSDKAAYGSEVDQVADPQEACLPVSAGLFAVEAESVVITGDDCYTPRWVFDAMGLRFDLDVAAPPGGPWHVPCDRYYTAADDGLTAPWEGLVWCNPPYSNFGPWARRWAEHETGVLMGTYTPGTSWFPVAFKAADAVAFITCQFERLDRPPIRPRHGVFVAFRGVGPEPAAKLADADRFGAVLFGEAS